MIDEHTEFDQAQQVVMEGEMRNFAVIPMTKDSSMRYRSVQTTLLVRQCISLTMYVTS